MTMTFQHVLTYTVRCVVSIVFGQCEAGKVHCEIAVSQESKHRQVDLTSEVILQYRHTV